MMIRLRYLLPILFVSSVSAEELTLETKPFAVKHAFDAIVLPAEATIIELEAEAWTSFKINKIAAHGASVKKDSPLLVFDSEAIDKQIADLQRSIAQSSLGLQQAKSDLENLKKHVPEQLARLKRAAGVAAEELKYFTETSRKSSEEGAAQSLKRQEQILASYQEELKQLLQMYEADDITEDTEEIILKKQRDSVEYAKFALRMEKLEHKRTLSVDLPRRLVALTESRDDTARQLAVGSESLPRSVKLKELEVAAMEEALKKNKENLADLQKDRKLFEIKAPADGRFYYGAIENGKWTTGDLVKGLREGGAAPLNKGFATFYPATTGLVVEAFLKQEDALVLSKDTKGMASVLGLGHISMPVTLQELSATPGPDGSYGATLAAAWPEGFSPVPGQKVKVRMVSYAAEQAVTVPTKALEFGPKGWTVEVKLADGKTERRAVTKGRVSGDSTEITEGLDAGQVVIVP
ncbi:MAG: hypothetical protein AB8D78_08445 [Akkermansiaceae bacterium]